MALWQRCPSAHHHTKLQFIRHPFCSSWGTFTRLSRSEFRPSSLYLPLDWQFYLFSNEMTFFQGYYSLSQLFVAMSRRWHILVVLVFQGLHLHLLKEARAFISCLWRLVSVARCRNLSSTLILLVAVFFVFFWKSYIVKACWVCLSARRTAPGSCLCAFKVLFWSSVCTVWSGVMGNFLLTKLISEGNNIALVYCCYIHQYDSYLAAFYF